MFSSGIYDCILWKISTRYVSGSVRYNSQPNLQKRIGKLKALIRNTQKSVNILEKLGSLLIDRVYQLSSADSDNLKYQSPHTLQTLIVNIKILGEMINLDIKCAKLFQNCMEQILDVFTFCEQFISSAGDIERSIYLERILLHQLLSGQYFSFDDPSKIPKFDLSSDDLKECGLWCQKCANKGSSLVLCHTFSLMCDCLNSKEKQSQRTVFSSPLSHSLCQFLEILCDNQVVDVDCVFNQYSIEESYNSPLAVNLENYFKSDHLCAFVILSESTLFKNFDWISKNLPPPYKEISLGDPLPNEIPNLEEIDQKFSIPVDYWKLVSENGIYPTEHSEPLENSCSSNESVNIHAYFRHLNEVIIGRNSVEIPSRKRTRTHKTKEPLSKITKPLKWSDLSSDSNYPRKALETKPERELGSRWVQFFLKILSKIEQKINAN